MKIDADKLIKELEWQRVANDFFRCVFKSKYNKGCVDVIDKMLDYVKSLVEEEEKRAENQANYKIDVDMYDEMELYTDCTVQVLHNTITDEYSVGWWQN